MRMWRGEMRVWYVYGDESMTSIILCPDHTLTREKKIIFLSTSLAVPSQQS